MVIAVIFLVYTAYAEIRGETVEPGGHIPTHIITRADQPEEFHNAMLAYTVRSVWFLIAGFLLLLVDKTFESSDPLSPDFGKNQDLDNSSDGENVSKGQKHTDHDSSA
ncbi:MAG TPA: hypothetical protein VGH42_10590 [Verrucomicrobiae bacterium]